MNRTPPTSPLGFAEVDPATLEYRDARAVIIPLPYDATTSFLPGTRFGPAAIIAASQALESFDLELGYSPTDLGIATLRALEADARGPKYMIDAIRDYCRQAISDGKFAVALGGEHTVSLGCIQAHLEADDSPLTVLQIDAHADLRDSYQNSRWSHACVMRRVLEHCSAIQVGIRSMSKEEYDFAKGAPTEIYDMAKIRSNRNWISEITEKIQGRVYLSIDLDGLDPSICPGVGTPEPGGLEWKELLDLLGSIFDSCDVHGADVVECMPLPGQHLTEYIAARLVYKLIGLRFKSSNKS